MILSLSDSILNEIYKFVRGVDHFIHQATSPDYKDMLLRIIDLHYDDTDNKDLFVIDNFTKQMYMHDQIGGVILKSYFDRNFL